MPGKLRDHSLSVVAALLFLLAMVGQAATGFALHNQDGKDHHHPEIGFCEYLTTGAIYEATF